MSNICIVVISYSAHICYRQEYAEKSAAFAARAPIDPGTEAARIELNFMPPATGPITDYDAESSSTRKLETRCRYLTKRIAELDSELTTLEAQWGISRWLVTDQQYIDTVRYIQTRRYQRALGRLQRLVIQRLFELHRLNISQTGMSY